MEKSNEIHFFSFQKKYCIIKIENFGVDDKWIKYQ